MSGVTPVVGSATQVVTGGQAVTAIPANPNGGLIMNPLESGENLYVNPVGTASVNAGGANFEIPPGGVWNVIPGQTTPTSVNAPSNNHTFSAIYW
jgi:hypothetical protein